MSTYCFDIDGTICTQHSGQYHLAKPIQERIDLINQLYDEGHTILFLTARGMGSTGNSTMKAYSLWYSFTEQQLRSWGVKFHQLIMGKPEADLFIDDKGIRDEDFFL